MVSSIIFYVFLALAAGTVVQAVLFTIQAWEHYRYAKSRLGHLGRSFPIGRAMVLVPCKGLDLDIEENFAALFEQDYNNFEIRFLVESTADPVYPKLRKLIRRHPEISATILTTGIATTCGQKVHNLRVATEDIPPHIRYLVFMDSDAQPRREWLRAMLYRICNDPEPKIGAVTGYRWMIPTRKTLGNYLVYAINSSAATLLGKKGSYPIWGGSWAIHRTQFEEAGIRDAWERTISDDLVAKNTLSARRRCVLFEPSCVVASPIDFSFMQALSFLRRQYMIGRLHTPFAWLLGWLGILMPAVAWWGALGETLRRAVVHGQVAWGLIGFCTAIYGTMVLRGALRQRLAPLYARSHYPSLRGAVWFDILAGPLIMLVNSVCISLSAIGSRLVWRRIIYTMDRRGVVRHIKRVDELPDIEAILPNRRAA